VAILYQTQRRNIPEDTLFVGHFVYI
jgi:hypothetical protein